MSCLDNLMNIKNFKSFFDNKGNIKFIVIISGKGGVGKFNISVNLVYFLYKKGYKVGVFDVDIGLVNLDVIFGVKIYKNILYVLKGEVKL